MVDYNFIVSAPIQCARGEPTSWGVPLIENVDFDARCSPTISQNPADCRTPSQSTPHDTYLEGVCHHGESENVDLLFANV